MWETGQVGTLTVHSNPSWDYVVRKHFSQPNLNPDYGSRFNEVSGTRPRFGIRYKDKMKKFYVFFKDLLFSLENYENLHADLERYAF
jgi:hypothetical protein